MLEGRMKGKKVIVLKRIEYIGLLGAMLLGWFLAGSLIALGIFGL